MAQNPDPDLERIKARIGQALQHFARHVRVAIPGVNNVELHNMLVAFSLSMKWFYENSRQFRPQQRTLTSILNEVHNANVNDWRRVYSIIIAPMLKVISRHSCGDEFAFDPETRELRLTTRLSAKSQMLFQMRISITFVLIYYMFVGFSWPENAVIPDEKLATLVDRSIRWLLPSMRHYDFALGIAVAYEMTRRVVTSMAIVNQAALPDVEGGWPTPTVRDAAGPRYPNASLAHSLMNSVRDSMYFTILQHRYESGMLPDNVTPNSSNFDQIVYLSRCIAATIGYPEPEQRGEMRAIGPAPGPGPEPAAPQRGPGGMQLLEPVPEAGPRRAARQPASPAPQPRRSRPSSPPAYVRRTRVKTEPQGDNDDDGDDFGTAARGGSRIDEMLERLYV